MLFRSLPDPSQIDPITGAPLPQPTDTTDMGMGQDVTGMGQMPTETPIANDPQMQKDAKKAEI